MDCLPSFPLLGLLERRTGLYVGTLRKFIEAMNGELVIAARSSNGVEIPISLAEQEDPLERTPRKSGPAAVEIVSGG